MNNYNIIYEKEKLENILVELVNNNLAINDVFSLINVINISGDIEGLSEIDGILGIEENISIEMEPATEWHKLRVGSKSLPMRESFIPKNIGEGVKIYLIDSGIYTDHPEFEEANIEHLYSFNDNFEDILGHGTAVASVIIGKTLGISTGAILKNVKIPMGQSIPLSSLLEAFNAIAEDKPSDELAVINCSWTIPKSMVLDNLVEEMRSQGFLLVAAAGNSISNADDLSPVGYDAVLGVGASDAFDRVVSWADGVGSNWGKEVDLFAPGIDVMVATKNGDIAESSGTSIAAGIVSSIAAQYIFDIVSGENLLPSVDEVQQTIILRSSKDVLFRNETIYETTPNALIMGLVRDKYFTNDVPSLIKINVGETINLQYELLEEYVTKINIDNIKLSRRTYHHADWITLDQSTSTITISPTEEFDGNYYKIYVEFLNDDNVRVHMFPLLILVGVEVGDPSVEYYHWIIDPSDNVTVVMQFFNCSSKSYACNSFGNYACTTYYNKGFNCTCIPAGYYYRICVTRS